MMSLPPACPMGQFYSCESSLIKCKVKYRLCSEAKGT